MSHNICPNVQNVLENMPVFPSSFFFFAPQVDLSHLSVLRLRRLTSTLFHSIHSISSVFLFMKEKKKEQIK